MADLPLRWRLHAMEAQSDAVLDQVEGLAANLAGQRDVLPAHALEYAALSERVENVTEELRWMRDQLGKLARRTMRPGQPPPGASGPMR